MAQHDQVIANGPGLDVRGDVNAALAALFSNSSGTTEPSVKLPYQLWADTTANVLKIRNAANNAWLDVMPLAGWSTDVLALLNAANATAARAALQSAYKDPVTVAATGNVNVSNPGTSTFDGVTLSNGDSILLPAQTAPAENGIYIFNGSGVAMTRRSDANTWARLPGAIIPVLRGTAGADRIYHCTADPGGTLGTTAVTFSVVGGTQRFVSSPQAMTAGGLITVAHSLGVEPEVNLVLICTTADVGYSVGQRVQIGNGPNSISGVSGQGVGVRADSTNVNVRIGAAGIAIVHGTNGLGAQITLANWSLEIRAKP